MNYLTDTSVVSPIMNGDEAVLRRLGMLAPADLLFTSVVTEAEIEYGLIKADETRLNEQRESMIEAFKLFVDVLPVTRGAAREYATLKHAVRMSGRTVPDNDLWISAIAAANGMAVLHRDRHFTYVPGLIQADWTA